MILFKRDSVSIIAGICKLSMARFVDGVNVMYRALVVPATAEPSTDTAPYVACMVGRIARRGCAIREIGCPSLVAGTDNSVHILGTEGRVVAAHRPFALAVDVLDLENAVALVAIVAVPGPRRAQALVSRQVALLALVPVRFYHSLRPHDVYVYAPFARCPLQYLVGCPCKVA